MRNDKFPAAYAILAFLQTVSAGTGLAGVIGPRPAGFLALIVAGFQAALASYHITTLTYKGNQKNESG